MKQNYILFMLIFVFCTNDLFSQKSGAYTEGGSDRNRTHPLTSFDRSKDISEFVTLIKTKIINDTDKYKKIYEKIYDNAKDNIDGKPESQAKDAAFVFLIGIKSDGSLLDESTEPKRSFFKEKYLQLIWGWSDARSYLRKENQFYRARENILLMQGYDYLVLAQWTGATAKLTDNENKDCREEIFNFTRKLHSRANNPLGAYGVWPVKPDNNHTLLVAAACGMGAIILHNRTTYFWAEQRKPKRWASSANAYINKVMWNDNIPMSERGKNPSAGYAEGPQYYRVAFEALWPYFLSFRNFTGGENKRFGPYYKCALCFTGEYLDNYYSDKDYLGLNDWYVKIMMPNGVAPTIDDTREGENFAGTALDGKPEHSVISDPTAALGENMNIRADYLARFNYGTEPEHIGYYNNSNSGNLIVRHTTSENPKDRHYIGLNAERETALNGGNPRAIGDSLITWYNILALSLSMNPYLNINLPDLSEITWGHEHGDIGSIIISAGQDILAMDPPFYSDKYLNNFFVNQGYQHNVITIDGEGPHPKDNAVYSSLFYSPSYSVINFSATHWQRVLGIKTDPKATIEREIQVIPHSFGMDYVINDIVTSKESNSIIAQFNLNGNGNEEASPTPTFYMPTANSAVWNHPCQMDNYSDDNWQMRLTLTSTKIGNEILSTSLDRYNIARNGNSQNKYLTPPDGENNDYVSEGVGNLGKIFSEEELTFGKHTRVYRQISLNEDEKLHFKATIEVLPCNVNWGPIPTQRVMANYTTHLLTRVVDSVEVLNLNFSRHGTSDLPDTSINPLQINELAILETDAKNLYFSYSTNPEFKTGNCVSYCNFRKARMANGRLFKYHDTTYISSTKVATGFYSLIGKCKYSVYTETDTACTMSFYLADVERGINMKVLGYNFTYDTGTCIMSIDLPVGQNQFEIELTDPCLISCFFPSTQETIHETFNFNEGITATLGHKLDIVQPHGFLNISKGSHMKICNGVYLRNRDSLVLYSGCGKDTGQLSISTCDGRSNGTPSAAMEGVGGGAKASMISVMDGAALILDDSSFTQISNNSELHVWGTLVIKAGAKLLIGDGRKCSYASIMVYPGAYVHIEDEAHLEFFKIVGDTQDRHIFFVSKLPTAASAIKGVAPSIVNLLLTDTILTGSETPVELCDLYTVTPDHGIANREWGFSNILKPKADIWVPNDTICQGECLLIDFSASLNDPIRSLEVCRIDTLFGLASEVCFGSMRIEGMQLTQGYNESSECYYSEASLKMFPLCNYIDSGNAWYKIVVKVENHCGIEDTQSVYFFVAKKPSALLALADTLACNGYGTVKAYNWSLVNAEKATYHVHVIDTTQYQDGDENRFFYGADWELFNLHYGDSFEFPDFKWQGGFKYAVSLTQYGWCGESNTSWDTVNIQPGAVILASTAGVYSNPLGPSALQLQGFVGNADYYTWSPTTDLDNPYILNPIATPSDTVTYVLSAFKGSCEAHDTLFVKHNSLAFAGLADTICAGESVILGTSFDASLFLGYQFYENHLVLEEINERLGIDINFFSKLSVYLLSNAGKTALNSCVNYSTFLSTLNREQFYQEPWYAAYLEAFSNTYDFEAAFNLFVSSVNNNGTLSSYIGSNSLYDPTCFVDFLNQYDHDIYQTSTVSMNATWEKYVDSNWSVLTHYTDQIKATDTLSRPSTYKITVIDNNVGKVEYDQVNIWVQQNIQPQFFVQFQIDSTLYFSNQSEPIDYSTQYLWDFGDGQTSTQLNPIHTFPFFDSSYIVCLSATNFCGTFSVCDTIRVDSSGLIAYSYAKKLEEKEKTEEIGSAQLAKEITIQSFPNPIKNEISFVYDIPQAYENGEIILMNYLGQTIQKTNIKNAKGLVKMNLDGHSSGMYLYQIIIDARVVKTGKLVKE